MSKAEPLADFAQMMGGYYKLLRRSGIPRGLAGRMVGDMHAIMTEKSLLQKGAGAATALDKLVLWREAG